VHEPRLPSTFAIPPVGLPGTGFTAALAAASVGDDLHRRVAGEPTLQVVEQAGLALPDDHEVSDHAARTLDARAKTVNENRWMWSSDGGEKTTTR
jgi:hypothetical protein